MNQYSQPTDTYPQVNSYSRQKNLYPWLTQKFRHDILYQTSQSIYRAMAEGVKYTAISISRSGNRVLYVHTIFGAYPIELLKSDPLKYALVLQAIYDV